MTAQKPRRTRRRAVPASALPRPSTVERDALAADEFDEDGAPSGRRAPATLHHRQHHVTKDYTYVHRDLLTILGVGIVVLAFIVTMSFFIA